MTLLAAAAATTWASAAPTPAPHRAAVVVRFSDGSVRSACVAFTTPTISGYDLLTQSGLAVSAQASGANATVCKIEHEGCSYPGESCFCQCQGGPCRYWAYWHLTGAGWQFSSLGASSYQVEPGGVDGWAWGSGSVEAGKQPPATTFGDICPADAATAVPASAPAARALTALTPAETTPPLAETTPRSLEPAMTTANATPPAETPAPGATLGTYALFGAALAGLLGWGVALRRRRP